ncbi:MAG TPA: isoprenylcysteine carboxylmethyltransferase family protein [Gemmatimonadales bacterium]|jgi:protein-S-isoprenylcysteine O-methyltransferase Ste14
MGLREEFEATGTWLFRRRGYLPLLLFPLLLVAADGSRYPSEDHRLDLVWEIVALLLALAGLGLRVATVGFVPRDTSGRNTGAPRAESLNTSGLYSVVRHPLYLGNYLMWLGVALFPRTWWPPVIVSLVFWLYYERIMFAEEEFLRRKFGALYTTWAASTPAFVPRLTRWRPPLVRFCPLTVLRREHSSLLALIASLTALEVATDHAYTGRLALDPVWGTAFGVTLVLCLAVRAVKHRTRLLHVEDR